MVYPEIQQFAEKLRQRARQCGLGAPEQDPAQTMPCFRKFLDQGNIIARRYHRMGAAGLRAACVRSTVMDVLLEFLFAQGLHRATAAAQSWQPEVALLALGGYGRAELCPFSDIDIMFLYPDRCKDPRLSIFQRTLNDTVLYTLWDLNLKVGHSTRTIKEAIEEANKDIQSKNSMLESRFLCGNSKLGQRFQRQYDSYIVKDSARLYIEERLSDQKARRDKIGNTVFLQEPDIKNGIGGLRDYQNLLWMARLQFDSRELMDLATKGLLRPNEVKQLNESYDFLIRVRNELHLENKRATDLLNLEKQPTVAWHLGYRQDDIFKRVELFMREYYQRTQLIDRVSRYLEQRLATESRSYISFRAVIAARRSIKPNLVDGFLFLDGRLSVAKEDVFIQDPLRLLRVFRHMQQLKATIDFELSRLINESLGLLTTEVVNSDEANRCFRSILQTKGEVYPALRKMNTTGVLSRILPEWANLHCLVQHEYYHRYTADEHTLNTIRELDSVFSGQDSEVTRKYRIEVEETHLPALLYLILLLHDIGKGYSIQGHAQLGAEMSGPILERMGVVPEIRQKVLFLIQNHLEMARFWQHYDIDDPRTVKTFSQLVGDAETLRYLYVLTFCDARGTKLDLWNSYKDTLHTQLFHACCRLLDDEHTKDTQVTMISKETIMEHVPGLSADEVEAHYNLLPERYFIYSSTEEIALHLKMVNQLLRTIAAADSLSLLVPVIEWQDDINLGMSVVHVVTWDRAGLFYKLAGAFSVAGLSIVSSKALTRSDHITIDTFYVTEPNGGVVKDPKTREIFQRSVEDSLLRNKDLMPAILEQSRKHKMPTWMRKNDQLKAPLPPSVDVYHELSLRRTIIEVQATDSIGLLYRLTKAIFDNGFDITFARISTERNVAVDTFYIEPINQKQNDDTSRLLSLRQSLNSIVESIYRENYQSA